MLHDRNVRHALLSSLAVLATAAACSDTESESKTDVIRYDVTPSSLPTLDLVGTSSPGDVWTFTSLGNNRYRLKGDKGTPADLADDFTLEGALGSLGTLPGQANQDADGIFIFRPDGVGPDQGVHIVRLTGFGYVLALPAGVTGPGLDPVHVVAVDRGPCTIPANARFLPLEIALFSRPDGFRAPSIGTFSPSGLNFAPLQHPGDDWSLSGASCDAAGDVRFSAVSTPFSRQTVAEFPAAAPTAADVIGRFSPTGAFMLDYGKGFGGSLSVPEATALPKSEADITTLTPLYRSRLFAGYITATSVFQPIGSSRNDPSVTRTTRSNTFWTNLGTTDEQRASLTFHSLTTGQPIAPGTTATFDLSTLSDEGGGAVLLINERNGGLNDLALGGPIIQQPGSRTISVVMSGYSGTQEGSSFLDAISPATPAGQEKVRSLYVAYLTLVPPRNCESPTLQWPAELRPAWLAPVGDPSVTHVKVIPTSGSIGVSAVVNGAERVLPSTAAEPVEGVQMMANTRLSLDAPVPGHTWRLFCGPDFLWRPGPRQDAQIGRGYSSDEPGFGLIPGTYILEHGPEVDPGATSPLSKHFVVNVCPPTGCPR